MAAPPATRRAETSFTGLGKRNTSFSATTKSILEWSGFTARTDGGGAVSGLYWPASSTRRRVCVQAILVAIQVVLAILVMLGILLQSPKATGLGGVIGGGGDSGGGYRRRRGLEAGLLRASGVLIALFVIVAALNTWVSKT